MSSLTNIFCFISFSYIISFLSFLRCFIPLCLWVFLSLVLLYVYLFFKSHLACKLSYISLFVLRVSFHIQNFIFICSHFTSKLLYVYFFFESHFLSNYCIFIFCFRVSFYIQLSYISFFVLRVSFHFCFIVFCLSSFLGYHVCQ